MQHSEVIRLRVLARQADGEGLARLVGLLSAHVRREEGGAAGERGGDRERLVGRVEAHAEQDELAQPRVDGQLREELARRRKRLVEGGEGAERRQVGDSGRDRADRRLIGKLREHAVRRALEPEALRAHHELLKRDTAHLRLGVRCERRVRRVQVHAQPVARPPRAPAPLLGSGARNEHVLERSHPARRVVALLLDAPRVDDETDVVDGDRRLGDVGGEHDLDRAAAAGRAGEDAPLLVWGE